MTRSFRISPRDARSLVLTVCRCRVAGRVLPAVGRPTRRGEQPVSRRIRRSTNSAL